MHLSGAELLVASLIVATGAMIQGSIGFGLNVFAAPLLVIMDTGFVPGPLLAAAFVLTLLVARRDRAGIDRTGFGWVFIGRLPASLGAAFAVAALPERGLAITLASMVLVAVLMSSLGWTWRRTPPTLVTAGALSGVMGTISSIGGPPVALIYQDVRGSQIRGTLSAIFGVGAFTSILFLSAVGRFGTDELVISLALVPGVVLGYLASRWTSGWLDRGWVRPAVLALCAGSAVAAMLRYAI